MEFQLRFYRCRTVVENDLVLVEVDLLLKASHAAATAFTEGSTVQMEVTPVGSTIVATALKHVELERVVGPSDQDVVRMGSFWQDQVRIVSLLAFN